MGLVFLDVTEKSYDSLELSPFFPIFTALMWPHAPLLSTCKKQLVQVGDKGLMASGLIHQALVLFSTHNRKHAICN
jgi:hypothetical protein